MREIRVHGLEPGDVLPTDSGWSRSVVRNVQVVAEMSNGETLQFSPGEAVASVSEDESVQQLRLL